MTEFINWSTLATYGGSLAMVLVLTQFTKDLPFTKDIPTQIWSYILAFVVLIMANAFTTGLSLNVIAQIIFNAVIISIAANGGYSAISRISGTTTDGNLLVDTSNLSTDIYRLELDTVDDLADKKTVTLAVRSVEGLSHL